MSKKSIKTLNSPIGTLWKTAPTEFEFDSIIIFQSIRNVKSTDSFVKWYFPKLLSHILRSDCIENCKQCSHKQTTQKTGAQFNVSKYNYLCFWRIENNKNNNGTNECERREIARNIESVANWMCVFQWVQHRE